MIPLQRKKSKTVYYQTEIPGVLKFSSLTYLYGTFRCINYRELTLNAASNLQIKLFINVTKSDAQFQND